MRLFQKKLDYQKDFLRMEFELEEQQYCYYHGRQRVFYPDLNYRTKKNLDRKNEELKKNKDLLQEEIKRKEYYNRMLYLEAKGINCHSFEYLGEVKGTVAPNLEVFLNNLVDKENMIVGIHRVGRCKDEDIKDILENGLILTGHLSSGAKSFTSSLSDNISFYPNNRTIIKELMYADCYKSSRGSILVLIPLDKLNDTCYADENGFLRLRPEYIVGFVSVYENHHIKNIIRASDFKKEVFSGMNDHFKDYIKVLNEYYENNESILKHR